MASSIGEIVNFIVRGSDDGAEELKATIAFGSEQAKARGERFDIKEWLTGFHDKIRTRLAEKNEAGGIEGITKSEEDLDGAALSYLRNAVKFSSTDEGRALMAEHGVDGSTDFIIQEGYADVPGMGTLVEAGVVESAPADLQAQRRLAPSPTNVGGRMGDYFPSANMTRSGKQAVPRTIPYEGSIEETLTERSPSLRAEGRYRDAEADTLLRQSEEPYLNSYVVARRLGYAEAELARRRDLGIEIRDEAAIDASAESAEQSAESAVMEILNAQSAQGMSPSELAQRGDPSMGMGVGVDGVPNALRRDYTLEEFEESPDLLGDGTVATYESGDGRSAVNLDLVEGTAGDLMGSPDPSGGRQRLRSSTGGQNIASQRAGAQSAGAAAMAASKNAGLIGSGEGDSGWGSAGGWTAAGLGAVGIGAAIANTITDFRTTASLEDMLARSAAGETVARQEGRMAGGRMRRDIMATSLGRRDISPALGLRNAQMAAAPAMSDMYAQAAIASANERRQSEASLAQLRKKRYDDLFGALMQTAGTVGSLVATQSANAETEANAKRLEALERGQLVDVTGGRGRLRGSQGGG